MRRFAIGLLGLILTLGALSADANPSPVGAGRCSVLIDASKSMDGYRTALDPQLMGLINELRGLCPGANYQFGAGLHEAPLADGDAQRFEDGQTLLGPSVRRWNEIASDTPYLVLVTDNVAASNLPASDPTQDFYNLLKGSDSPFTHIAVVTLRAPFDGMPYLPNAPDGTYQGPRALTIYVLAKTPPGGAQAFTAFRQKVLNALQGSGRQSSDRGGKGDGSDYGTYAVFDIKPFAIEEFSVSERAGQVRQSTEPGAASCKGKARFEVDTGTFIIENQPMRSACEVATVLTMEFPNRWCLRDTGLSGEVSLKTEDPALSARGTFKVKVDPNRATLCKQTQTINVVLRFDPFEYRPDVSGDTKLDRSFEGKGLASGHLVIVGQVERKNVELGQDVASAWSYDSQASDPLEVSTQRKVYRLQEVVRAVIPGTELDRVELARYKVHVKLLYDQTPILSLLFIGLALLLLVAGVLWLLGRPRTYEIDADGGEMVRVRLGAFATASATASDGVLRIDVRNLLLFLLLTSNGRILRGALLSPRGGKALATHSRARPRRASRPSSESFDDDYDDYDDSEPVAGRGEHTTFTVRLLSGGKLTEDRDDDRSF